MAECITLAHKVRIALSKAPPIDETAAHLAVVSAEGLAPFDVVAFLRGERAGPHVPDDWTREEELRETLALRADQAARVGFWLGVTLLRDNAALGNDWLETALAHSHPDDKIEVEVWDR